MANMLKRFDQFKTDWSSLKMPFPKSFGIKRSTLLVLALFFFLSPLVIAFLFAILYVKCPDNVKPTDHLWGCTSLECSLNRKLNPCDDFYEFVCSGFMHENGTFPAEYSTKSQFNILWHQSWTDVIGLLKNDSLRESTEDSVMHQMFHFYHSCLNDSQREADKSRGLFAHLKAMKYKAGIIHGFDTNWVLRAFPFVPFFDVQTTWDVRPQTEDKNMFMFQPRQTLTDYAQLMNVEGRQQFTKKMSKLLHHLLEDDLAMHGKEQPVFFAKSLTSQYTEEIERRVQSLVEMEIRIGRALNSYQDNDLARFRNLSQPELYLPLSKLTQLFTPSIDWFQVLLQIDDNPNDLSEDTPVLILGHDLLLSYRKILDTVRRENPQMLSDYLDWALVWRLLFQLDTRFAQLMEPWTKNELNCVRHFVRVYFKHQLDKLYVNNVFDKQLIAPNKEMLSYVKRGFAQLLDEAAWMDAGSKAKAKLKLAQLKQNIGYFRLIEDNATMGRLYEKYTLAEGMSWAEMVGHLHRRFYLWPTLDYQGSYWVDGFYKWVYNSLAIYGAIIRPPWFNAALPAVMNFGAMGTFMGHEVTHGYDSMGRHFDARGNLRPEEELDKNTMARMEEAMECFVDQYGQYKGERKRPNDRFTLAENIADNGGIRASYKAWQLYKAEHPVVAQSVPAVLKQFDEEQLFFISSAFMYCFAMPEKDANKYAWTDNHAFPRARVNLPLRNFEAFSRAFQCPAESAMNAGKHRTRCRLW